MLDDKGDQLFANDGCRCRARAEDRRGTPFVSIGQISRLQRIMDNNAEYVAPLDMIAELREDNVYDAEHARGSSLCDMPEMWLPQACWKTDRRD